MPKKKAPTKSTETKRVGNHNWPEEPAPKPRSKKDQVTVTTEGTLALVPEKPVKAKAKRKPKDPIVEYEKTSKHFLALLEVVPSKNLTGKTMVDELKASIKKYLIPEKRKEAESEMTDTILARVDHDGLSGPDILSMMRDLQQAVVVRPGFLKILQNLEEDYEAHTSAVAG
jgi:hypothetical protein